MEISFLSYEETLQDLFQRRPKKKTDLKKISQVLEACKNPHLTYPTIHVAGTNGKGQVAVKTARALQFAGYKVGLFISPHLFDFEERISINGILIDKQTILQYHQELEYWMDELRLDLHFFECTTYFAFRYFQEKKVDVAVIEAGLGGKLDTTNVIQPIASAITSISLDHTAILGHSTELIAKEKAGVIKLNTPVILGPNARCLSIMEEAKKKNAPLHLVEKQAPFYEMENREIARKVLQVISKDFSINEKAIEDGLEGNLSCRFEKRENRIYDVAHNPDGFYRLRKALEYFYPHQKFRFVIGMSKDKDLIGCLLQIGDIASHIHFVQAKGERSATPLELSKILQQVSFCPFSLEKSISEGMEKAKAATRQNELLVVCGSFYIMAEAYKTS